MRAATDWIEIGALVALIGLGVAVLGFLWSLLRTLHDTRAELSGDTRHVDHKVDGARRELRGDIRHVDYRVDSVLLHLGLNQRLAPDLEQGDAKPAQQVVRPEPANDADVGETGGQS